MTRALAMLRMQIVVSVVLLVAGIYFLVWSHDETLTKLAAGWIGAVIGYWLK